MNILADLIGSIQARKSEIAASLAAGNATTWEAYQRMVGTYQGLQDSLDILDNLMKEDENE